MNKEQIAKLFETSEITIPQKLFQVFRDYEYVTLEFEDEHVVDLYCADGFPFDVIEFDSMEDYCKHVGYLLEELPKFQDEFLYNHLNSIIPRLKNIYGQ